MLENLPHLPSLIEIFLNPTSLILFVLYGMFISWEVLFPAKSLPKIEHAEIKNIFAFIAFFILSTLLPLLADAYLSTFQLLDLDSLGTAGGAVLGIVFYELGFYVWHRILHDNSKLWKTFHQMHHSSIDNNTNHTFFVNPVDIIGCTLLGSICLVVLFGLSAQASTVIILITTFFAIFKNSNIKTPIWIGYFIKRPESHSLHHEEEGHAHNYSSLTFIDMLFGTFKNPKNLGINEDYYLEISSDQIEEILFKDII
ncbi:MAG: sterol desaturase family protein [Bacteroidetes bacterium]|nr:sterol desaturase family protein [Bacteroidota bacterium]